MEKQMTAARNTETGSRAEPIVHDTAKQSDATPSYAIYHSAELCCARVLGTPQEFAVKIWTFGLDMGRETISEPTAISESTRFIYLYVQRTSLHVGGEYICTKCSIVALLE